MYETKKIREIAERKSDEIAQIQHSIFDLAEYGYEVQKVRLIWKHFWKKKVSR